jgi:hypothetical protein
VIRWAATFVIALSLLAAMGVSQTALAGEAVASSTAGPSASAEANSKKDPCASTKSKWAHMQCESFNSSAPGDEYFGRMKMSYLGIDNTFKDMSISSGAYTTDQRIINKLLFADEALQRWAAKYPADPQLARSYFLGLQVFRKVYTQPIQQLAWQYIQILTHRYASSYFGKTVKASLTKDGFTEHWFALPQMCPTPLPKGVMPENTPSATATPSPAPGQPAIDLITPPCIQPSPSPSPLSSASPSPTPHR